MSGRQIGLGVAVAVGIAAGFLRFGMKGRAEFESLCVCCDPLGGMTTGSMVYRDGRMPKWGWDGATHGFDTAEGDVRFHFTFLRHRDGKDVYRVVRVFRRKDGREQQVPAEVAYDGKQTVVFQDELGRLLITPLRCHP